MNRVARELAHDAALGVHFHNGSVERQLAAGGGAHHLARGVAAGAAEVGAAARTHHLQSLQRLLSA